nr:Gfo/Idh/MocA family oxidoreductase [Paenibacillus eucommiae]
MADISQTALDSVQSEFGIPAAYTDYREMLDKEELDAVSICTPNKYHAPAAIYALQKGVHVFCEKPMALHAAEAQLMLEASKAPGKILSIGFHYRHMAQAQAAKRVIAACEIGHVYMTRVQALRRRGIPTWGVFTNKELQGGGALVDFGVHLLDLALWLIGNPKVIEVPFFHPQGPSILFNDENHP